MQFVNRSTHLTSGNCKPIAALPQCTAVMSTIIYLVGPRLKIFTSGDQNAASGIYM